MRTRERSIVKNPSVAVAVLEYRRAGIPDADICARLRISRATLFRCLKRVEQLRDSAPPPG